MKEIEFRGKRIDGGGWIFGSLLVIDYHDSVDYVEQFEISLKNGHSFVVEKESVGQYTGLRDKNGVKIFEGDIILGHLKVGGEAKGRVYINDEMASMWGLWIADGPEGKDFGSWDMRQLGYGIDEFTPHLEVIGNIYENPELLNGGSK